MSNEICWTYVVCHLSCLYQDIQSHASYIHYIPVLIVYFISYLFVLLPTVLTPSVHQVMSLCPGL